MSLKNGSDRLPFVTRFGGNTTHLNRVYDGERRGVEHAPLNPARRAIEGRALMHWRSQREPKSNVEEDDLNVLIGARDRRMLG
jgi:hypothetical protein